jgi:hypothetical protein
MRTTGEPDDAPSQDDDSARTAHRRAFIRRAGAAAVAGAAAAMGMQQRSSAAIGDPILVGQSNGGTSTPTRMTGSTLVVQDGSTSGFNDEPASIVGTTSLTDGMGVYGRGSGPATVGVMGVANGTGSPAGVYGVSQTAQGTGVYGRDLNTASAGYGVRGVSARGTGVSGAGERYDLEASLSGRVNLAAAGVTAPPAGASVIGTLARDDAGNLWFCAASGTPGTWRRLAGPASAGAFHAIDPVRVHDSRRSGEGPLAPGVSRTVAVRDAIGESGEVTATDVVAPGATAVAYNVTVTGATGPNFFAVTAGDATGYSTSTVSFGGGVDVANASVVRVDAERRITVWCGDQAGSAHVIVDICGYYL